MGTTVHPLLRGLWLGRRVGIRKGSSRATEACRADTRAAGTGGRCSAELRKSHRTRRQSTDHQHHLQACRCVEMPAICTRQRCGGSCSQQVRDGDLPTATLQLTDQKLTNIYPLPGVGQFPYTTLDLPKPLFPGDTSIGIKQIAPVFISHALCMVFACCRVLRDNEGSTLNQLPS